MLAGVFGGGAYRTEGVAMKRLPARAQSPAEHPAKHREVRASVAGTSPLPDRRRFRGAFVP